MKRRTFTLFLLGMLAAVLVAGVALATVASGLTSELVARGGAGEFKLHDKSMKLKMHAKEPTDVAIVKASLAPGGYTGWHGHPGPSLVAVKSGTITMYAPGADGSCSAQTFGPGQAFVHPEGVHNFVSASGAEFGVAYFVPAGAAPLLRDEPVPAACS